MADLAEALLEAGVLTPDAWRPGADLAVNVAEGLRAWARTPLGGRRFEVLDPGLWAVSSVEALECLYNPRSAEENLRADLAIGGAVAALALSTGDVGTWHLGGGLLALERAAVRSLGEKPAQAALRSVMGALSCTLHLFDGWSPCTLWDAAQDGDDTDGDDGDGDGGRCAAIRSLAPGWFFSRTFGLTALRRLESALASTESGEARMWAWRAARGALALGRALEARRAPMRAAWKKQGAPRAQRRFSALPRGPWSNDAGADDDAAMTWPLITLGWGEGGGDEPDALDREIDDLGELLYQSEANSCPYLLGFDARPGPHRRAQVALALTGLAQRLRLLAALDETIEAIDALGRADRLSQRVRVTP